MGDIADMMINGDMDFFTGEYIGRGGGFPRTLDRSLPWEKRKKKTHNPRKGVLNYIHQQYSGKAQMPSAIKIAKHYAIEAKIEWKSEEEMFAAISEDFQSFAKWFKENAGQLLHTF